MKKTDIDYIKSLIPHNVPDGKQLVLEGLKMGKDIPFGKCRFLKERGYTSYMQYREDLLSKGRVNWEILLGLSTLNEELEGIKAVYEYGQRTGLDMSTMMHVTNQLTCLPKEFRDNAPSSTAYMIETAEERIAHNEVAPIQSIFGDHTLSCPNSLETTIGAVLAGSARVGILSQFIWDYYGFDDDLLRYSDMMKSIGIVASKAEEGVVLDTYMDDGIPSYFMDSVSYVGYALLEDYIVTNLCKAPLSIAYGGLLSEGKPRMAVGMAIDKLLSKDGRRALSYINSSTVMQWDHDTAANYGPSIQEMLLEILVERKYKFGWLINPVAINEKVAVPTLQDLIDITAAGMRLEECVEDWEDLMDFTKLEQMRDLMAEKGLQWFNNALNGFKAAGVNIENPLELIMVIKKFNYPRLEEFFHPSVEETGILKPYFPTVLGRQTAKERDEIISQLKSKGYTEALSNKKIIVASADGHSYGLVLIDGVFKSLGANIVNGGVAITQPEFLLDLADEEGTDIIAVSVHNGQSLDYAKKLIELATKRDRKYKILMGGMLNAILPGDSEATDVSDKINALGIFASNDLEAQVKLMSVAD
jgi:methylmalonyl-CoA mutase cobalamin-binding subunit